LAWAAFLLHHAESGLVRNLYQAFKPLTPGGDLRGRSANFVIAAAAFKI
jgi:hypothetical protein